MSYIYFSWLNSIPLYEVMPTLDDWSDFSSSSPVAVNAGEAFLISSRCPIFLPFQHNFLYCILWFGLRVNNKGDQMLLSGCVREGERHMSAFMFFQSQEKIMLHLYKYFTAVRKKFCNCRALDKQFQLTWFTLILKCLGKFGSFTDNICCRKLIFPSRYWLFSWTR